MTERGTPKDPQGQLGSKPLPDPRFSDAARARTHHGCVEPNEGVEVDARADGVGHSHQASGPGQCGRKPAVVPRVPLQVRRVPRHRVVNLSMGGGGTQSSAQAKTSHAVLSTDTYSEDEVHHRRLTTHTQRFRPRLCEHAAAVGERVRDRRERVQGSA